MLFLFPDKSHLYKKFKLVILCEVNKIKKHIMINTLLALYSWTNGVVMIAIFALVCITLVGILINFMMKGKGKEATKNLKEDDSSKT